MGGLNTQAYGDFVIHSYTDLDETSYSSWLAVVVVWRRRDGTLPKGWRARLRALQYRVGMDVLNAPFHIGRDGLFWHGAAGPLGQRETLFHDVRRVVRVLGKEIEMPKPGHTLFIFLDEAPSSGHGPTILMRSERSDKRLESPDTGALVHFSSASPFAIGEPLHALAAGDEQVRAFLLLDSDGTG